jgi:hypothetical protein
VDLWAVMAYMFFAIISKMALGEMVSPNANMQDPRPASKTKI